VGIKIPALEKEKTYRLFIEEIPEASKTEPQGTQVAVKLRFGVPIFVKPLKEEPQGEIENLALAAGKLTMVVKNTGNEHFIINSISITSGELFATELQGWYLLTGASRAYSVTIPPEICNKLSQVNVAIKTDKLGLQRSAAVNQSMCQP
jgi:fimbrial chaperone protein